MKLLISLVGRTNVGKSSLFNRLIGKRINLVSDDPGLTRDRVYGDFVFNGRKLTLIDTGGIEFGINSKLSSFIKIQTDIAIKESDIVFFLVDGRVGLTEEDQKIADLLRRSKKRIYLLINKTESSNSQNNISEFYKLGFKFVFPISGIHGQGISYLFEEVFNHFPFFVQSNSIDKISEKQELDSDLNIKENILKLAILGTPNSGKSSLINKFIGEDRLLVSSEPGTTIDSVNVEIAYGGSEFQLTDTAGVRRKRSIFIATEKKAVASSFGSIDRAQIVLILIDAARGVTEQDLKIASLVEKKSKGVIIVVNKWDIAKENELNENSFLATIREKMSFLSYAPIKFVSALTGYKIFDLLDVAQDVHNSYNQRISTGQFNRVLNKAVTAHQPPLIRNSKRLKFFYGTQVATAPPTFLVAVNNKARIHFSYQRYLVNRIRNEFNFKGSPIRMVFRERS